MPLITVKILAGRTVEQKRKLVKHLTDAASKDLQVAPEKIIIDIIEYGLENFAGSGELYADKAEYKQKGLGGKRAAASK